MGSELGCARQAVLILTRRHLLSILGTSPAVSREFLTCALVVRGLGGFSENGRRCGFLRERFTEIQLIPQMLAGKPVPRTGLLSATACRHC